MDPRLLPYARRSAPRYTSYPSAAHFSAGVSAAAYGQWLAELAPDSTLSLYLHVPYCRHICWYCDCTTYPARRPDTIADFVEMLRREIDLVAEATPAHRVCDIHWGGGTPNILDPDQFTRAWRHLAFWFDVDHLARHVVEIDPRTLTPEHVAAYRNAGVTRASLGVQDFSPQVLRNVGRDQTVAAVERSVAWLRASGIGQIGMDLMYGLAGQTEEDVIASVRNAAALAPQQIAVFGYAHMPLFKKRQRLIDATLLPSVEACFDQAAAAREELVRLGYLPIGFDHFCLPGDQPELSSERRALLRTFHTADQTDAILGIGPSAISSLPQGYAQNHHQPGVWARAIQEERLPVIRGHRCSPEDRQRQAIIEHLMCDFAVDLHEAGGASAFANELAALAPLAADGLVMIEGDLVTIPPAARPFCRLAAQAFDTYRNLPHASGAI